MKLLIVGADEIYSIENYYVKHLRESGVDVRVFTSQKRFYRYYNRSVFNKVKVRLGISRIYKRISRELQSEIIGFSPSVVWVFKGMEVESWLLKWATRNNIKLVNFNGDNPYIFTGRGSGNKNVTNGLNLYDLHFTYNRSVLKKLVAAGLNAFFLPFGFEVSESLYNALQLESEVLKVCFLGNPDSKRADFLHGLAVSGISIDIYGHGWDKFVKHENLTVKAPVYGDEQWRILRKYRVQLNLLRIHNLDSHNMRTFEVPAVGGIMLAPDTPEHRDFFVDGKEIFLFKDLNDCVQRTNDILNLSPASAKEVRIAARTKSIQAGYSYKDRAISALHELSKIS